MIRKAIEKDKIQIVELFCSNIKEQTSYISHGEIQMGIALDTENLADDFIEKWKAYLDNQMLQFGDTVLIYEQDADIKGFIIGEIDCDRADDYGVICDLVVNPSSRNMGIGDALINTILDIFYSKNVVDIYLESGINNHTAHAFFEKKGFKKVSSIFMLNNKQPN